MYEFSPEEREEFNLEDFTLDQLDAARRIIRLLAAGKGGHILIEGYPTSRLSNEEQRVLTPLQEQEIRLAEDRQVYRAEALEEIANEIDELIYRKVEEEGMSGLS